MLVVWPETGEDMAYKYVGFSVCVVCVWKRAGKQWKAWGPKLHVVSCYAPMRVASRQVKDAFFQDLESIF